MTPNTTNETEINDTSLTIRRAFNAPPERMFEAWTDPEQVTRWWCPDGFTITIVEMDVQPGGIWRYAMTGPDGETYQNCIVYDEIKEPVRLAYTHGSPEDSEQFRVTVISNERDSGMTELPMEMRFPSAEAYDETVEFGAVEGAKQTLGKLAEHLADGVRSERGGEE